MWQPPTSPERPRLAEVFYPVLVKACTCRCWYWVPHARQARPHTFRANAPSLYARESTCHQVEKHSAALSWHSPLVGRSWHSPLVGREEERRPSRTHEDGYKNAFFRLQMRFVLKNTGGSPVRYGQQHMDGDACWLASSKTLSLLCCPLLLVHVRRPGPYLGGCSGPRRKHTKLELKSPRASTVVWPCKRATNALGSLLSLVFLSCRLSPFLGLLLPLLE